MSSPKNQSNTDRPKPRLRGRVLPFIAVILSVAKDQREETEAPSLSTGGFSGSFAVQTGFRPGVTCVASLRPHARAARSG
jgi:hypothetical protein